MVVAEEPVEGKLHLIEIFFLLENIVKLPECHDGVSHIDWLLAKFFGSFAPVVPAFVGDHFNAFICKCFIEQESEGCLRNVSVNIIPRDRISAEQCLRHHAVAVSEVALKPLPTRL